MIHAYEIKKGNDEDVLFLYLSYDYELSSDLGDIKKEHSLKERVSQYIKDKKIDFKGKYIVLVVGGIMTVAMINRSSNIIPNNGSNFVPDPNMEIVELLNTSNYPNFVLNQDDDIEILEEELAETEGNGEVAITQNKPEVETVNNNTSSTTQVNKPSTPSNNTSNNEVVKEKETMVTVYRSNGTIITISLEEYLIGVVGSEMPASFNSEALKAQSIVARTYALKQMETGKVLTDTTSTQVYKDNVQLKMMWGSDYYKYYTKVKEAVDSTKGLVITYNDKYIDAVYHSTSNGFTVDAVDVWGNSIPYLKSVSSTWDMYASSYLRETMKNISDINKILGITIDANSEIKIISRDSNGRIKTISIDGKTYTGVQLRNLLGLRSTDFDIEINMDHIIFTTRGYGHGVGMSQYGANGMAKEGFNYSQIITHYYSGVKIVKK